MIRDFLGAKEHLRFMLILPLFHCNAQINSIMTSLIIGASSILTPGFSAQTHWENVAKYKASIFSCAPTVLSILLRMPHENLDLSSLEYVSCGNAPLPVEVFKAFENTFSCKIIEGYGLTEGTCSSSVNPLPTETEDRRKVGSIGIPLPGNEMKIVDESDNDIPPNTKGEIVIKGDNIMKGYFKNPEANAEIFKEGWLYTGDIGLMDEDGFFYITDRKKDIYPREIEEVLNSHPAVSFATVIGVRDNVKAFVVLKEGESITEEEIIEYCRKNLADFKVPKYVEFRDDLPKTPTGKIIKQPLREEEEIKDEIFRISQYRQEDITEEDITFYKERKICLVCKGGVSRINYICPECGALYCIKCEETLANLENACWFCNTPLDESKPSKPYKKEKEDVVEMKKINEKAKE